VPKGILIGTGGSCIYFSTTDTKEISKIDPISLTISESLGGVGTIGGPNEIVLHVSGKYIYASGLNSATLSVVDDTGPSMVLRKILTLPAPAGGLAVHPDGSKLYVSLTTLNQILVLDTVKLNEPLPGGINKPLYS
jgi:DNA-binding beta-propeller fold protein YncE